MVLGLGKDRNRTAANLELLIPDAKLLANLGLASSMPGDGLKTYILGDRDDSRCHVLRTRTNNEADRDCAPRAEKLVEEADCTPGLWDFSQRGCGMLL